MSNEDNNGSYQLVPLNHLCRNTFQTILHSPSNPSIIKEVSEENDFNPSSTQNTILSIFDSPNTARINGNIRLSVHQAEREFNIDETIIDKEDMKRRMSVISTNIEYTFKGIRKTLNTMADQKNVSEECHERKHHFEEVRDVDQYCNSSSEENTTEEENHSEIINALPNFPR